MLKSEEILISKPLDGRGIQFERKAYVCQGLGLELINSLSFYENCELVDQAFRMKSLYVVHQQFFEQFHMTIRTPRLC